MQTDRKARIDLGLSLWFAIRTLLTGSAMCVPLVSASHAADIELTEVQNDIRELIRRGSPVHPSDAAFHDYRDALQYFYGPSGYAPACFVPAGSKPMVATALASRTSIACT